VIQRYMLAFASKEWRSYFTLHILFGGNVCGACVHLILFGNRALLEENKMYLLRLQCHSMHLVLEHIFTRR